MSKPSSENPASLRNMGDRTLSIKHPETGKSYAVGSLQIQQLMEYEEWLGAECVEHAKKFISRAGDVLSAQDRATILSDVFEESKKISLTTPEGLRLTESLRGTAQLLFLCIRRLTPSVTLEEVLGLITPGNLEEVTRVVDAVAGLGDTATVGNETRTEDPSIGD